MILENVDIGVESTTIAMKARKLLKSEGISAKVIKTSDGGCMYALRIKQSDFFTAVAALRRASISYRLK